MGKREEHKEQENGDNRELGQKRHQHALKLEKGPDIILYKLQSVSIVSAKWIKLNYVYTDTANKYYV